MDQEDVPAAVKLGPEFVASDEWFRDRGITWPPEVTVVIPTIPPRAALLRRALSSVFAQTYQPSAVVVQVDKEANGAAFTRNEALKAVRTPWVAFLDDDDQMLPNHLETLVEAAVAHPTVDYLWTWFLVDEHGDPLGHYGRQMNWADPHQTTITTMVRTVLAQAVGFREPPIGASVGGLRYGEDYQFTVECVKAGASFLHIPARTWRWNWHAGNTSGRPWKR